MRVLVIGGTGFIGPHVVAPLVRGGHDVAVFHRPARIALLPRGVREIVGDRADLADSASAFRAFAPDVVVDLILGSRRQAAALLDAFRHATGRFVVASSMDVYRACGVFHGSEPGGLEPLPLTERSALRTTPQTYPPRALAKLRELFGWVDDEYDKVPVERALADSPLPVTTLRLPMVYGPGDPLRRFQAVMRRVLDGRTTILLDERTASWRATRGYVEDVGAAIALAAVSERAVGAYNVGEVDALTEREWVERIAGAAGWRGAIVTRPGDRLPACLRAQGRTEQHWVADTTRIRDELGYVEPVGRDEGIRRTVAWERTQPAGSRDWSVVDYAAEDQAVAGPS